MQKHNVQIREEMEFEFSKRLAVHFTGRDDAVPTIDMKENIAERQIDTTQITEKDSSTGRMGTRKHPVGFGKVTSVIKDQSEMSYENDNS